MSFESLTMLGHMTEAGAGDYPLNSKRVDTSEDVDALRAARSVNQLAEQQNPQEIDLSQKCGSPPKTYDTTTQTRSDASRAHADTSALHHSRNLPISKHGGVVIEERERMQTFHGDAIHSGIPQEKSTIGHKHQQIAGDSLQGSSQQRELLTYPEGEDNAVTITEKDMEGLEPMRFLSNNVVDFYIRYVERRLSREIGHGFYFFNTYFFTKLLKSTACTNINHSKVDYEQLRKWTGGVNLFEKDYIFIPVIKSGHWSLIVICHLSSLTSSNDEKKASPCMLHLDPIEGQHESFESQVRSYFLEAWKDKFEISDSMDQFIALSLMKYVQCEVPRQDNNYDCGLYLLHYIEVFLQKSTSLNFKFVASEMGVHFISPNFEEEVCAKRTHILNLIHELRGISQEQDAKRLTIQNLVEELSQTSQKYLTFESFVEELSKRSQNLLAYLEDEGYSKGRIKVVQNNRRFASIVQGNDNKDVVHLLLSENAIETQYQQCSTEIEGTNHQTTWRLGLDNKLQDGVEVADVEYQTRSKAMLDKEQYENAPCMVLCDDRKRSRRNTPWSENQALGGSIEDVQNDSPIMFHTQGLKSKHAIHLSIGKNTIADQQHQCLIEDEVKNHQSSWELGLEDSSREGDKIVRQTSQIGEGRYQQHETIPCVMLSEHRKGKNKRGRSWTIQETSILLSCKAEGGRFCKETHGATHWNLISQEIGKKLGTLPSDDQCRLRYDTLLKAYKSYNKYCTKNSRKFLEITEEERLELKLATTLTEEWYKTIDEICQRRPYKVRSQKRAKLNSSVCNEVDLLSSYNSPPHNVPSSSTRSSFEYGVAITKCARIKSEVGFCNDIQPIWFSTLNVELRTTLLNLVQDCSMRDAYETRLMMEKKATEKKFDLEEVCQRLAIVQDCVPKEIHKYILKLAELKLVTEMNMVIEMGNDLKPIHSRIKKKWFLDFGVYENLSKEVLCKIPYLKTYHNKFSSAQSSVQDIKVLNLYECNELECLDLKGFPDLRCFIIKKCINLISIIGWEVPRGLGWLEIRNCHRYNFLGDHCIDSSSRTWLEHFPQFTFHQCIQLKRVEIISMTYQNELIPLKSLDVKTFRVLEVITFQGSRSLRTLQGLSTLLALTHLDLQKCEKLSTIEDLSQLQALTYLNLSGCMSLSSIEGLSNLLTLTHLNLQGCLGLSNVEDLSKLQALTHLHLSGCKCLSTIKGLSNLLALIHLDLECCEGLSTIEDLSKLQALTHLNLRWCRSLSTIQGLSNLLALTILDLEVCESLLSIEDLSKLQALTHLNFSWCKSFSAIQGLSNLLALTHLAFRGCFGLLIIEDLSKLQALTHLNLSGCSCLSTIQGLSNLLALTHLDLEWCEELSSIEDLSKLQALTHLKLCWCKNLSTIQGLGNLITLTYLNLRGCLALSNIEDLSKLQALTHLNLSWCKSLSIIQGLSNLFALTHMNLEKCEGLSKIEDLSKLQALSHLNLSWSKSLSTIQGLSNLIALIHLDLTNCEGLSTIEDLSKLQALTHLNLSWCKSLSTIKGLSNLLALTHLAFRGCFGLLTIEDLSKLRALTYLNLSGCSYLSIIKGLSNLLALTHLDLEWCEGLSTIKDLSNLQALTHLKLSWCKSLVTIQGLGNLFSLTHLNLRGCLALSNIEDLSKLQALTHLNVSWCKILSTIQGLSNLIALIHLDLKNCKGLSIVEDLSKLQALSHLNVSGCTSLSMNKGLSNLIVLVHLDLSYCSKLSIIEDLSKLQVLTHLNLSGCTSLLTIQGFSNLIALTYLDLRMCVSLSFIEDLSKLQALTHLNLSGCRSLSTIQGLSYLTALTYLNLENCERLSTIENLRMLQALTHFKSSGCMSLSTIQGFSNLVALIYLDLGMCASLSFIEDLSKLQALTHLNLSGCRSLSTIQGLSYLTALTYLNLENCERLSTIENLRMLQALTHFKSSGCTSLSTTQKEEILTLQNLGYKKNNFLNFGRYRKVSKEWLRENLLMFNDLT